MKNGKLHFSGMAAAAREWIRATALHWENGSGHGEAPRKRATVRTSQLGHEHRQLQRQALMGISAA